MSDKPKLIQKTKCIIQKILYNTFIKIDCEIIFLKVVGLCQ